MVEDGASFSLCLSKSFKLQGIIRALTRGHEAAYLASVFPDLLVRSLFIGVRGFLHFIFGNIEDQIVRFVE